MKSLILATLLIQTFQATAIPRPDKPESGQPALSQPINVILPDNRSEMDPTRGGPWAAFGRLTMPNGGRCSATLVGPDLLLTAAHCTLTKDNQHMTGNYQFFAGYINGRYVASAGVTYIWRGTNTFLDTDNDWAIMKLDRRLGDQVGSLGVQGFSGPQLMNLNTDLWLIAYPSDHKNMEVPLWEKGCNFRATVQNRIYVIHDCDTSSGTSGSSMFIRDSNGGMHVVAVNVAERRTAPRSMIMIPYSNEFANVAVPSSQFLATLRQVYTR